MSEEYLNVWNSLEKEREINATAEVGDLVFLLGGILFLIQTKNGYNNVICKRVHSSDLTLIEVIKLFRERMIDEELQYIRVEGNLRRYNCLPKILKKLFDDSVLILKDIDETKRNVFYIKCY